MGNRWRFLYHMQTELRGHVRGARARNGKPRASAAGALKEKPQGGSRWRDADRTRVGKRARRASRKAAIALHMPVPQTDTGGWGEYPKAGGRSIVKELGKTAP